MKQTAGTICTIITVCIYIFGFIGAMIFLSVSSTTDANTTLLTLLVYAIVVVVTASTHHALASIIDNQYELDRRLGQLDEKIDHLTALESRMSERVQTTSNATQNEASATTSWVCEKCGIKNQNGVYCKGCGEHK